MQSKVFIARVEEYIPDLLEKKLKEGFEAVGGIEGLVSGKDVFVKINQLSNQPPEEAVTTHPLVVEKAVKLLLDYGAARVTIGDDIQNGKGDGFLITGMRGVAQKLGVELVNLKSCPYVKIEKNGNRFLKELYVAKPVLDADVLVNLPKLKTHSQTILTAAIKNLYGIIPLGERTRLHASFSKIEEFSEILVDIFNARPPELNILDGILGMEGEGPQAGSPRKTGIVLISKDAVAMDSIMSSILGLDPVEVRHIAIAASRGLGSCNLKEIETAGIDSQELKIGDFKFPKVMWQTFIPRPLLKFFYKMTILRPKISAEECVLCGRCVERCPVKAMEIRKGKVTIDYKVCIGCLCCQEICSSRAIKSARPCAGEVLLRVLRLIQRIFKKK